ncbi:spermatogenesis-associated protein 16 [Protopterus annectens]|uniref:spermatogenesis-associated protein 16 n=1 Tax=Protopterus annectens TaxID=7888 RepID=UPI001CFA6C1D|nr:spermatogenesis-associated protein 16 [Protopterus annectens]
MTRLLIKRYQGSYVVKPLNGDFEALNKSDNSSCKKESATNIVTVLRNSSLKGDLNNTLKTKNEKNKANVSETTERIKTVHEAVLGNYKQTPKSGRTIAQKGDCALHEMESTQLIQTESSPAVKEDARLVPYNDSPCILPLPLPQISMKIIKDVETKLVYSNEQYISHEFAESKASTSAQSMHQNLQKLHFTSNFNSGTLQRLDMWLEMALSKATSFYTQKKYSLAVEQLKSAIQLCSKGAVSGKPFDATHEDICNVASFAESKLAECYLRMKKPYFALNHSHRSIILNPLCFRNHLRQAAVFRCLGRYSEAARSTMVADYMYLLSGGMDQQMAKNIKLYWQAMLEEAITRSDAFSVMYTPSLKKLSKEDRDQITYEFKQRHPDYVAFIYTDPEVAHILPQKIEWSSQVCHHCILTIGFRNKEDGNFLEILDNKTSLTFGEEKHPFHQPTLIEAEANVKTCRQKMWPVLHLIASTKLFVGPSVCSGTILKLQYASFLSQLKHVQELSEVINQAMAEIATIPYLLDISQKDADLLQALMADAMDALKGNRIDKDHTWNKIHKITVIEDFIYNLEANFLKAKVARKSRRKIRETGQ